MTRPSSLAVRAARALRVTWDAGHSSGATVEDEVETWTDPLSFLLRELGERGWRPPTPP